MLLEERSTLLIGLASFPEVDSGTREKALSLTREIIWQDYWVSSTNKKWGIWFADALVCNIELGFDTDDTTLAQLIANITASMSKKVD